MPHSTILTTTAGHYCGSPTSELDAAGVCPRCVLAMSLRTRTLLTLASGTESATLPAPTPAEMGEKFP